jgi:oligosaccharide repeat unit polymerase
MFVFFILLISLLFLFIRKSNTAYSILVLIIFLSFFLQYLVGRSFEYKSYKTVYNAFFICLNLFLIVKPWSDANILNVENTNPKYFAHLKKILYKFLFLNLILNAVILFIVLIYIPDISSFKAQGAYTDLYDQIPYFANVFRYAYVTQSTGYLAIPIFFYHLGNFEYKKASYALLLSSSSLLSGFAFYSRAQIFTYTLLFILYFFLVKKTLPRVIKVKVLKAIKYTSICIVILFLSITYIRFSAMDYYGDRIPQNSIVKDPIIYSLIDYASQNYSNGLYQLERFTADKSLGGEQFFRDIFQILNFFGVIEWDVKESKSLIDTAYDYDGGAFKGYTTPLVFNFGYILTFLISLTYFFAVTFKLKNKAVLSLKSMFSLILLLIIPTVSIFYTGYALLLFPLLLLGLCRFTFIRII